MLFSVINISYVSLNMHVEQEHTQKNEEFTWKSVKKIQRCILQQVRYSTVEYNFMIECDVCIGKFLIFMNHRL